MKLLEKNRPASEKTVVLLTIFFFTLLALIQKQLLRHRKLYVAFIDFRKAFDTVCRTKLWNILYRNGLGGKIATALQSMYAIVKA